MAKKELTEHDKMIKEAIAKRWQWASRYMTPEEARMMFWEIASIAGYHCPVVISEADILQHLTETYRHVEEMETAASLGGQHAANCDWSNEAGNAIDIAVAHAEEWLADNEVELTPKE